MLRLHVPGLDTAPAVLRVDTAAVRHLRARRVTAGDRVLVFDGAGGEHICVVERIERSSALLRVLASERPERESPLVLVLAQALLKGPKMDLVIEKATELGVARIAPVATRHAVGRGEQVARWRRVAVAAAKQSGRTRVPAIDPVLPFDAFVASVREDLRLLPWEGERDRRLADVPLGATTAVLLIGPEGGFAGDEVATARRHGFLTVTLGPRVLRAETAAIAAVALCQHRLGDG